MICPISLLFRQSNGSRTRSKFGIKLSSYFNFNLQLCPLENNSQSNLLSYKSQRYHAIPISEVCYNT